MITHQIKDSGLTQALSRAKSKAMQDVEDWELWEEIYYNKRLALIGYRKGIEILLSSIILFRLIIIKGIFLLLLLLKILRFLLNLL